MKGKKFQVAKAEVECPCMKGVTSGCVTDADVEDSSKNKEQIYNVV